jgi:hypothetical protein
VRVIYFYYIPGAPISLMMIYAKSTSDNLTEAQKNWLYEAAKRIKKRRLIHG